MPFLPSLACSVKHCSPGGGKGGQLGESGRVNSLLSKLIQLPFISSISRSIFLSKKNLVSVVQPPVIMLSGCMFWP